MIYTVRVTGGIQALVIAATGVKVDRTEEGLGIMSYLLSDGWHNYPLYVGDQLWVNDVLIWEES